MRLAEFKKLALALPHTTVVKQWGETLVFKIGGKMFLIAALDGEIIERFSFKCDSVDRAKLLERDEVIPAPYLARASWLAVIDPGIWKANELEATMRKSYELVKLSLSRKIRATPG